MTLSEPCVHGCSGTKAHDPRRHLRYAIAFALRRSRKIIRGLKEGLTEDERATRLPIMPSGNSRSAADPWRLDEEVKAAAPMTI